MLVEKWHRSPLIHPGRSFELIRHLVLHQTYNHHDSVAYWRIIRQFARKAFQDNIGVLLYTSTGEDLIVMFLLSV